MRPRRTRRDAESQPVAIDGFDVLERIGAGGFAVVYRARQRSMNREVAVKVLNTGFSSDAERRTFERECHALGRLSHHPNIVTVFDDAMTTDGRPCIVMELYRSTYRQRVDDAGPLAIPELLEVGVRTCGALQTAHDGGVLHRDLKPHNIFISAYGEPALGDFGISTLDDERSQSGASGLSIAYAAPEVLEDGRASVAADVYSLAATLYQLAVGRTPVAGPDLRATVRRILTDPPPPTDRDDAPPGLDRVLRAALAKDPAERPGSALELAEALREVQARLGLGPTPIPRLAPGVAAPSPPSDPAPSDPPHSPPPPPGTTPRPAEHGPPHDGAAAADRRGRHDRVRDGDASAGDVSDGDVSAPTIARPRPLTPPVSEPDDADAGARRWAAPIVGAVAVAALVIGVAVVALSGDDGEDPLVDDPTVTTPGGTARPPDDFFELVAPPSDVVVEALGDGRFEVSFDVPDEVSRVEVEVVGAERARIVDASPVVVASDGNSACVVLRSLGERGRVSPDVGPICSG